MDEIELATPSSEAERIYSTPLEALANARELLANDDATSGQRAEALLALGRAAYYANEMSDAVQLLHRALSLAQTADLRAEILVTLAPAVSKNGDPEGALALLDDPKLSGVPRLAGQLRNQRGIIFAELGQLREAMDEMRIAVGLLRDAGDEHREARTLVNLGAAASIMGLLDKAEEWYELARVKTVATGQHLVAAGIVGNLGYVASRRGNFATALRRYDRARSTFKRLGEVGLLLAVLEVDHARTLLDVGLVADALTAAEQASRSAANGGNQMLLTQADLLIAEALLRLRDDRGARAAAQRAAERAKQLGQRPWELRAAFLDPDVPNLSSRDAAGLVGEFVAAGWTREAHETALAWSIPRRRSDPRSVRSILAMVSEQTAEPETDVVTRGLAEAILADTEADSHKPELAIDRALAAIAQQRDLLGSVEMQATIGHRTRLVLDLGVSLALGRPEPAGALLTLLEKVRLVRSGTSVRSLIPSDDLARLRDARVGLDEAKLDGADTAQPTLAIRRLERAALQRRRSVGGATRRAAGPSASLDLSVPPETAYVTQFTHRGAIRALVHDRTGTRLVELGPVSTVELVMRRQRTALRRLADERRNDVDHAMTLAASASAELAMSLIEPLRLDEFENVVLTPATQLREVTWSALASFGDTRLTLTTSLSRWNRDTSAVDVRSMRFLGGPGLSTADAELRSIAEMWRSTEEVEVRASCAAALDALRSADLVHIAAHGSLRTDNPFFTSVRFADGQISILEMSELERLPAIVILASCDAAAVAAPGGASDIAVDTATELCNLGVQIVVAPTVQVNDAAASEVMEELHRNLADGVSVDESMLRVRRRFPASGEPRRFAAACSFHLFGGRSTQRELLVSGRA